MSDFRNPGMLALKPFQSTNVRHKGVVICGLPRSGTTAFAVGLKNAGFDLGDSLSNVLEDVSFRKALVSIDLGDLLCYFEQRKEAGNGLPWCVKFPQAYKHISKILDADSSILVVIVTRDPFCVALRNNISMLEDIQAAFRRSVEDYDSLYQQIALLGQSPSVVIVSYEKIIASPKTVFAGLIQYILPDASRETLEAMASKAADGISLNSECYLAESRLDFSHYVELDKRNAQIRGWCILRSNVAQKPKARKPKIDILYSSGILATVECSSPCPAPKLRENDPDGECYFSYSYDPDVVVAPDSISLCIKGTQCAIEVSHLAS